MSEELKNTIPICPECGSETFTEQGEEDYYNIWCGDADFECEWFAEVDY